jgi:hypothetical protein
VLVVDQRQTRGASHCDDEMHRPTFNVRVRVRLGVRLRDSTSQVYRHKVSSIAWLHDDLRSVNNDRMAQEGSSNTEQ